MIKGFIKRRDNEYITYANDGSDRFISFGEVESFTLDEMLTDKDAYGWHDVIVALSPDREKVYACHRKPGYPEIFTGEYFDGTGYVIKTFNEWYDHVGPFQIKKHKKTRCEHCGKLEYAPKYKDVMTKIIDPDPILKNTTYKPRKFGLCTECMHKIVGCRKCGYNFIADIETDGYCEKCFVTLPRCTVCKKTNVKYTTNEDEEIICVDCAGIEKCHGCGEPIVSHTYGVKNRCSFCVSTKINECYRNINGYDFQPNDLWFYESETQEPTKLFFGIELEVKNPLRDKTMAIDHISRLVNSEVPFVYFKEDRSIGLDENNDTRYGPHFECVTNPFSLDFIHEKPYLIENLLKLKDFGCKSFSTNTCAMHIHMSRDAFDPFHLHKFLNFFYSNKMRDFVIRMSDRTDIGQLDKYATFELAKYGLDVQHLVTYGNHKETDNDKNARHIAVNLATRKTVEVRIFKGTLNYKRFMKNLELCKAAYDFTKISAIENIEEKNFVDFVVASDVYPNLKRFVEKAS